MKFLVITTINQPTVAIYKYRDLLLELGWKIIIVGDWKTPHEFCEVAGVDYLSVERQQALFGELATLIPLNHYARKSLGYLHAIRQGAELIAESDDDNIPYPGKYPNFLAKIIKTPLLEDRGAVNIYSYFTDRKVWPRGLPLDCIKSTPNPALIVEKEVKCYIQQGLADLDPDVDAIYRLAVADQEILFEPNRTLALGNGCYCPFNTQNTLFYSEAFPLMLLPIGVHSRITDIWRGYIAQKILWQLGANLLFLSPSVYQIRNEHNLLKDFQQEVPLYTQSQGLIDLLAGLTLEAKSACDSMHAVYSY